MQGSGQGTNKRSDQSGRISGVVRNSSPVAPENSALADELRRVLKGKPTISGFNRSLKHEVISFLAAVFKVVLVAVLCVAFGFGGFGHLCGCGGVCCQLDGAGRGCPCVCCQAGGACCGGICCQFGGAACGCGAVCRIPASSASRAAILAS